MSDDGPLTFLASIALATGALKTMADGGFRVTLDIPETELPAYARLHLLRNTRLKITVNYRIIPKLKMNIC